VSDSLNFAAIPDLNTETDVALRAGLALARPVLPALGVQDQEPYAVVPDGYRVERLGHLVPRRPIRTRQAVALTDVPSFVAYVSRFAEAGTLIYTDEDKLSAKAIIDHPLPEQPDWGQHVAMLKLKETREWAAWKSVDRKRFDQTAFAEFIENHLLDVAVPDGASLLEMVKQLDIRKSVVFESSIRLDNGQVQLTYVETVSGAQAKSTATIPETFVLGVAPFEGADRYKLVARLRYRLAEGKVSLWFELLRPEDIVREAWLTVMQSIAEGTGVMTLAGAVVAAQKA
jgi:uncharacterized protein YfdQ (DUF2303 family)